MAETHDISFEIEGKAGIITLDRQHALNAITSDMVDGIAAALDAWEDDERVTRIIIRAVPGRAFSAGGDIRQLYDQAVTGAFDFDFFVREYRLNERIHAYPKPYIAMVDGIVMGGGVGVSYHGSHVVMGDQARFAMPEVGIGFFPDVGASYLLSRLKGPLSVKAGLFIGMTGIRIKAPDAVQLGLASHHVPGEQFDVVVERLCEGGNVDEILADAAIIKQNCALAGDAELIAAAFSQDDPLSMIAALEANGSNAAESIAAKMRAMAPLSLFVANRLVRKGRGLDMRGCMEMEYRLVRSMLTAPDFREGIRAAIIDKDGAPKWQPARLEDVTPEMVDACFADLPEGVPPLW
ncbi:enoyl-CoA hydratase/isomerase family protein [Ahrensia sp. R2A130]|uniref:enoyl-CoA hydratase/isomerase family protein n=1 Tax=Ahrensia sp. R2A130 TaxID=744979 RepID=UPI00058C28CC|nr:enoyl-CoA hydratase/isomerase family protein [Ahrensia sp. R2A130]